MPSKSKESAPSNIRTSHTSMTWSPVYFERKIAYYLAFSRISWYFPRIAPNFLVLPVFLYGCTPNFLNGSPLTQLSIWHYILLTIDRFVIAFVIIWIHNDGLLRQWNYLVQCTLPLRHNFRNSPSSAFSGCLLNLIRFTCNLTRIPIRIGKIWRRIFRLNLMLILSFGKFYKTEFLWRWYPWGGELIRGR